MSPRLDSSLFTWEAWRAGSLLDAFKIPTRSEALRGHRARLRAHVLGWCPAGDVAVRPKPDQYAVMFSVDGATFWTHLLPHEFLEVCG